MSKVLLVVLFFIPFLSLGVECGISTTQLFPENHNIDVDQLFMLQNGMETEKSLFSINNFDYSLKSEQGEIIDLLIFDSTRINLNAQILLKPDCPLKIGTKYFFYSQFKYNDEKYADLPDEWFEKQRWKSKFFIVDSAKDYNVPKDLHLDYKEIVGANELKQSSSIGFTLLVGLEPNYFHLTYEVWYEVTIRNSKGELFRTYLKPYKGNFEIGYWECGGNMRFDPNLSYEIKSTAMAMNGLKNTASEWRSITNPWKEVDPLVRKTIIGR